ncbi:MAG TPA: TIGR03067 domain-containing protein [Candidatus Synoicihabitans sp.]|nr:TIGR03067 domain-containing protein [Candidatus Synoicihabitans sp.]
MLDGTWIPQGAEFRGTALPAPPTRLIIRATSYVIETEAGPEAGELIVDDSTSPARLDFVGKTGTHAGQVIAAIFRQRGNLLQICYAIGEGQSSAPRPTELATSQANLQVLVRYRRELDSA